MSPNRPLARSEGLITEELDGELLVYDSESNLAHALDPNAAAVWRACDGHDDAQGLAARCAISEEDVLVTLARLGELGLLQDAEADQDGDTRRVALRKIGIAGAGLTSASAIGSILVPAAAAAGSCVATGHCVLPGQSCCVGFPYSTPGISHNLCPPPALGECVCVASGLCPGQLGNTPPARLCCSGNTIPDSSCAPNGVRCA